MVSAKKHHFVPSTFPHRTAAGSGGLVAPGPVGVAPLECHHHTRKFAEVPQGQSAVGRRWAL